MTLNKGGRTSEIVLLTPKLPQFKGVGFSPRNPLVGELLLTGQEEGLPSRIWEVTTKGTDKGWGNGRKWGAWENRKTICRYSFCYKLLCPKAT